jgi:hypothetical protein
MAMDTEADNVLTELKKLREGPGLTVDRLKLSGSVMSALGTSDPEEGFNRLLGILNNFAPSERVQALFMDFGLEFRQLVGREPTLRERQWLGDRRSTLANLIGRDVKTLARWSDRTVAELRGKLLADQFNGDLIVMAAVDGDRIAGCTLTQQDLDQRGERIKSSSSLNYDNPTSELSMPCLIYGFPRDWKPATLTLVVAFRQLPHPSSVWAVVAPSFFDLSFGEERYEVTLDKDTATCKIMKPRRDRLYAVWWRY